MNIVMHWTELTGLIQPFAPANKTGRPSFPIATIPRIHFMQHWFGLRDPAIFRFRHLLEANNLAFQMRATVNAKSIERDLLLKEGTVVDTTLIAGPRSTKNNL